MMSLHSSASVCSGSRGTACLPRRFSRQHRLVTRAQTIVQEVVMLDTASGKMRTEVLRPAAPGKYPGVLLFSEIFQITGPVRRSAQLMAGHGFVVVMPEIYHELLPPNTPLPYDGEVAPGVSGADRGNELKTTKTLASYDADSATCVKWLQSSPLTTGKVGVMGFCVGGHLAYRGALNAGVQAAACMYATDMHKCGLGAGMKDDSLARAPEMAKKGTEVMFVWGKQDPHVPREGRAKIYNVMADSGVDFSWHEFNGQHAFMRDEGPRYDAELSLIVYQLIVGMFRRKLGEGCLPVADTGGSKESKH